MRIFLLFSVIFVSVFYLLKPESNEQLVIYSGRSKALVEPVILQFEKKTGIRVQVKYGGTTQLAVALMEEGSRTPADVFWAQDAGALGALSRSDLLQTLPEVITDRIPSRFSNTAKTWVATSGRARVLAFSMPRVDGSRLPGSVFELTDSVWRNRVAWAPANGSFQAFASAMMNTHGEAKTREWLIAMKNNGAKAYANNNAILQAIAAGEADLGITNHYYLFRSRATNPNFPVDQRFFEKGDIGNMLNVAGAAILKPSKNQAAARRFIEYLLSESAQEYFSNNVFEYPVTHVENNEMTLESILGLSPAIDLEQIDNLESTLKLLRETSLL